MSNYSGAYSNKTSNYSGDFLVLPAAAGKGKGKFRAFYVRITQQAEHPAFDEEGVQYIMENNVLQVGSRVRVTSYTPFRGLRGTIQTVDAIPPLLGEELFCYYRIALEGAHIEEQIWFEHDEVEIIGAQEANSLKSE